MSALLLINNFLAPAARERILTELRDTYGEPASIRDGTPSGRVDSRARKATIIVPSPVTRDFVVEKLQGAMRRLGEHFGTNLTLCEDPQFLRYVIDDYFVAHQDGNTPLMFDDTRFRRISVVIILGARSDTPEQDKYGGSLLVIHGGYPDFDARKPVPLEPGMLAAFRSETTHEVTPVTHGERYSIVSWYR